MNRALRFTLLGLAVVVVLFAVTWITLPSSTSDDVTPPASIFARGLTKPKYGCLAYGVDQYGGQYCSDVGTIRVGTSLKDDAAADAVRNRILVFYGSLAAVIVLVGLAFGAGRRASATDV